MIWEFVEANWVVLHSRDSIILLSLSRIIVESMLRLCCFLVIHNVKDFVNVTTFDIRLELKT